MDRSQRPGEQQWQHISITVVTENPLERVEIDGQKSSSHLSFTRLLSYFIWLYRFWSLPKWCRCVLHSVNYWYKQIEFNQKWTSCQEVMQRLLSYSPLVEAPSTREKSGLPELTFHQQTPTWTAPRLELVKVNGKQNCVDVVQMFLGLFKFGDEKCMEIRFWKHAIKYTMFAAYAYRYN